MVLLSDPSKARSVLGWEALVSLEDGLRRTAMWLGKHIRLYDPERYHR